MTEDEGSKEYQQWLSIVNDNLERFALITFYVYIIAIVLIEVFRRYVLNFSSLWGSQTAIYIFIYLSWVGMSWAAYKRVHIRMNIAYQFLSQRMKTYLYIVNDLAMIVFALLTVEYTYPMIQNSLKYSRTVVGMDINQVFFQIAIPFGMILFVFRTIQRLYGDICAIRNDEAPFEGGGLFELGETDG